MEPAVRRQGNLNKHKPVCRLDAFPCDNQYAIIILLSCLLVTNTVGSLKCKVKGSSATHCFIETLKPHEPQDDAPKLELFQKAASLDAKQSVILGFP